MILSARHVFSCVFFWDYYYTYKPWTEYVMLAGAIARQHMAAAWRLCYVTLWYCYLRWCMHGRNTQEDTDHTRAGRPALELAYSFKLPRRRPGREAVTVHPCLNLPSSAPMWKGHKVPLTVAGLIFKSNCPATMILHRPRIDGRNKETNEEK
jgi:hypothetical protein